MQGYDSIEARHCPGGRAGQEPDGGDAFTFRANRREPVAVDEASGGISRSSRMSDPHRQEQKIGVGRPDVPRWASDLKERLDARVTSVFVLHFNVADEVRLGDEFVPIETFLGRWLAGDDRIIVYDRSHGLRFSDHDAEALF